MLPSFAIAYRETAPSAKFVVNAYRPSFVTTAQQISLRPLPIERDTGVADPALSRYEDEAAFPVCAPNASVTTSVSPANAKPYGVGPEDGEIRGSPSRPQSSTGIWRIAFVPRSVTTCVEPSGLKPTCPGSEPSASRLRSIGS